MKEEHFFYTPKIRESNLLPDDEFAHAVRVLRFGVGDHIRLMDGVGYFYDAQIKQVTKKFCEFEVVNEVFYPRKKSRKIFFGFTGVGLSDNLDKIISQKTLVFY